MRKKVTLIAPPWYSDGRLSYLSANLGLGYIAAYLEKHSYTVQIIDAVTEGINNTTKVWSYGREIAQVGLSYYEIIQRIDNDTALIGISVPFTMHAQIAKELACEIKNNFKKVPLVFGGVYPSTLPEDALISDADYIVQGEGELPLLQLLEGKDPNKISGLCFRDKNQKIVKSEAELISNLDIIPFPARHLLPMDKYLTFSARGNVDMRTASIITSRGCPYTCDYCSVHDVAGYRYRPRSPENVLKEIEGLLQNYQINHIEFEDDNLTLNKKRAETIFDGIVNLKETKYPGLTWSCHNGVRVDSLNRKILLKMKNSGCIALGLGVESGDPATLSSMNKKIDKLEKIVEVAKICNELGLTTSAFMIVGHPGETKEGFKKSLEFFLKLKKIGVKNFPVHIINAYPGTPLYKKCKKNNWLVHEELTHTRNILGWSRTGRRHVGILTKDITSEEVLKRRDYAHRKLNPKAYYIEKFPRLYYFYKNHIRNKLKKVIK